MASISSNMLANSSNPVWCYGHPHQAAVAPRKQVSQNGDLPLMEKPTNRCTHVTKGSTRTNNRDWSHRLVLVTKYWKHENELCFQFSHWYGFSRDLVWISHPFYPSLDLGWPLLIVSQFLVLWLFNCTLLKGRPGVVVKLPHFGLKVTGSILNRLSACKGKAVYINPSLDLMQELRALGTPFNCAHF